MIDLKDTFFQECEDLLEALEEGLRKMSDGETDSETVNSVFRAVHSIKGGAGAFKLSTLVGFAHIFETLLDKIRSGKCTPDDDVMRVLLHSSDHLADLVGAARDKPDEAREANAELVAELNLKITGGAPPGSEPEPEISPTAFQPMVLDFGDFLSLPASSDVSFRIRFAPNKAFYRAGHDSSAILRNLRDLGKLEITKVEGVVPELASLDPDEGYLIWHLLLTTGALTSEVHEVFEFCQDLCPIEIREETPPPPAAPAPMDLAPLAAPAAIVTPVVAAPAAEMPSAVVAAPEPAPAPLKDVAKEQSAPKSDGGKGEAAKPSENRPTVRVDLERVDRLINAVGELVINQAVLTQAISKSLILAGDQSVESALDALRNLSREIQEGVMAIRAQPVKGVFQRMFRIAREAADAAGKRIELITLGDTTEVDKTVIERLTDPLTHMIRNSVDHGIESEEKRTAAGKSPTGVVTLSAAHRSGRVVIEVSDDGAGINRERVKDIAIEKGLVPPDADLTPAEIDALLFLPGFSTAKEVSALSGRGVGMDVVKRAIESLGGRVSIASTPGKGTVFTISLPLTLAVLDGMVIEVAGEQLVVPITAIVETLRPNSAQLHRIGSTDQLISVRGAATPLIDLGHRLGFRPPVPRIEEGVLLLVETETQARSALIVDRIHDQRQVVIKSLDDNYAHIPGIAAATILGNGRIALIIDPDQLANAELRPANETHQLLAG